MEVSGRLCVYSSCINSSACIQVSARTCQWSTQTFDSGGTMLDGDSLAPHTYQHVGRCSSAVPHHKRSHRGCLSRPGIQGSAISAFNLWLLSDVCYTDRDSLPQSVRQWQGQLECLYQRSTSSVGRNGWVGVFNRVYHTMLSLLLN